MGKACVIGAGYLGTRIATELAMLGVEVSVYDRNLSEHGKAKGQKVLEDQMKAIIKECEESGLLKLAGLSSPVWQANGLKLPQFCPTIKEAVRDKNLITEAIIDLLDAKVEVFAEVAKYADKSAIMTTNSVSLNVRTLQDALDEHFDGRSFQILGLRFLSPVVFLPFVATSITPSQMNSRPHEALLNLLGSWGKIGFMLGEEERLARVRQQLRQKADARRRGIGRQGPLAIAAATIEDLLSGEECCYICLSRAAEATASACGHAVLCGTCAGAVEAGPKHCPICGSRFATAREKNGSMKIRTSRSSRNSVGSACSSIDCEQEDRPKLNYKQLGEQPPAAAIIGAGFLGCRIAAELLLLGADVAVFDQSLVARGREVGQIALEEKVFQPILESGREGLLELAGIRTPIPGQPWEPFPGMGPRTPHWCATLAEAVNDKAIVIDCVPDDIRIKTGVFLEAARSAPPGVLLATSTVSLPLEIIQASIDAGLDEAGFTHKPRVVGLRFLAPVVFVPFVEVTLTLKQNNNEDRRDLMTVLDRWGKGAFVCDVQGAAEAPTPERGDLLGIAQRVRIGLERLRLDSSMAKLRQMGEARLRKARRAGPDAIKHLKPNDVFRSDSGEDACCVCLSEKPTVSSVVCGHCCLCESCAALVESGQKKCPLCRARFMRAQIVDL